MLLRVHSARTRVLASLCVATVMGCGESGGGASGNGGTADVGRPDAMAAGGADARPASDAVPPEGGQVPDAGAPESDAGDGPADARPGSDAVVRPDAALRPVDLLCLPCTADGRCETPGAICLTNQATGEQFCGLDCSAAMGRLSPGVAAASSSAKGQHAVRTGRRRPARRGRRATSVRPV
jgi:hypothetical protein